MSATESVSERLADRDVRVLAERRQTVESALSAWRTAVANAQAARERADAARDAARAADGDDDEEELTRCAAELHHDAERAAYDARRARGPLVDAVGEAEADASRARADARRMAPEDAARVERAADVTTEHARAARDEARLGPSPEETARQRSAEWVAAQRAAAVAAAEAPSGAVPATVGPPAAAASKRVASTRPRRDTNDDESPTTAFPKMDWRSLSEKEQADRIHHALALIATAESHYRDPPSWRDLERETGISARKLRTIEKLANEMKDAERSAALRHQESLRRHAAKKPMAV